MTREEVEEALESAKGGLRVYEEQYPYLKEQIKFQKVIINVLEKQIDEKAINPDDETQGHFHFVHGYLTCKKTGKDIKYPLVSIEDFSYCPRCGKKLRWGEE